MNHLTNSQLQSHIVNVGHKYGLDTHSNDKRIKNPNDIKSEDFIKLLESMGYGNINMIPPKTGKNNSSVFNAYEFNDGNKDRLITLTGSIQGRGTNQTRYQELSFLLILSSYQQYNSENILDGLTNLSVYSKVIENGKSIDKDVVDDIIDFLNKNPNWYDIILHQVKILDEYLDNKIPLYYVKDYKKFQLNMDAKSLFKSDISSKLKWNTDKWNPSDIWLVYDEKLPKFMSLEQLNLYLYKSINEIDGMVGISLKRGDGNISSINIGEPKPSTNGFKLKYGKFFTQNLYTLYEGENLNGTSVIYRIFMSSPNELIRGEVEQKQSSAVHGKVCLNFLSCIDNIVDITHEIKSVMGSGSLKYKNNKYSLTSLGKKRFNIVSDKYRYMKQSSINKIIPFDFDVLLNEDDFINKINTELQNLTEMEVGIKISARFQTIVLGSYFAKLYDMNKGYLMDIATKILLYAKSMSDWSAPHLKVE